MSPPVSAAQIRRAVIHVFHAHGAHLTGNADLEERIRVENGKRVAHCYNADGMFAMWLVEVGLVQFYDADGNMLQTLNLRETAPIDRAAA